MKLSRRTRTLATVALLALAAAGCRGSGGGAAVTPPVAVAPPPPPPPTGASYNSAKCLDQVANGFSYRGFSIPDVVTLDLNKPAGFPNGRRLQDPVIDTILSYLFLDQTRHTPQTLVNIPLNPATPDQPYLSVMPYYAKPLGSPPLSTSDGTNFNFRTNPESDYVRVDRLATPAVSTINILSGRKNPYNDALPVNDANGEFSADIQAGLEVLTGQIFDDLQRLGLTPCATPR